MDGNPSDLRDTPQLPEGYPAAVKAVEEQTIQQRNLLITVVIAVIVILGILVAAVWFLVQPTTNTERIRDVFIIVLAALTLVMSVVLILLIVQLARLINLLQNEIRPILDATVEATRTLKGTAAFLSEHLAEPVIKASEAAAGIQKLLDIIRLGRTRR